MNDEPAGLEQSGPLVFLLVFLHALLRGMYPKCDGCSMDLGEGCVVLVSPVRLTCHSCVSLLSEISLLARYGRRLCLDALIMCIDGVMSRVSWIGLQVSHISLRCSHDCDGDDYYLKSSSGDDQHNIHMFL